MQQVDFMLDRFARPVGGGRLQRLLLLLLLTSTVVMAVLGWDRWQLQEQAARHEQLKHEVAQLAALTSSRSDDAPDDLAIASQQQLEQWQASLRQLAGESQPLEALLLGLEQANTRDVWLTAIALQPNGSLTLEGQARNRGAVARWVAGLTDTPGFSGLRDMQLRMMADGATKSVATGFVLNGWLGHRS